MSKLNRPFQPLELQPYTIHFLEIGYGPDTKWKEKFQKKAEQHAALANILTQTHWKVIIHPIIFGVGGTIFNTDLLTQMQNMSLALGREVFIRQLSIVRDDGYADFQKIFCPTLVIASRQDQMRSLRNVFIMFFISNANSLVHLSHRVQSSAYLW